MKYDFTSIMDRRGKDALAIDSVGEHIWGSEPEKPEDGFDFIPMWVADMNFPTCPSITGSIVKRVQHPAFGYFRPAEEYYNSIIKWQKNHFGVTGLTKEHIGYENGVHGFNLAGLIGSFHIIYSRYLRDRICSHANATHYNEMNVLSMHALIGAYQSQGAEWLEELRAVLEENTRYAVDFIRNNFSGVEAASPQGTYMIFLDCTKYCAKTGRTIDEVLKAGWKKGVVWQDGRAFGGSCHIRMNLALPLSRIEDAFVRLKRYVFL